MEKSLEPRELLRVGEDDLRDPSAVGARRTHHISAEPLDERAVHVLVVAQEPVDDLVAGDDRRAMARERLQRLALARPDPAGEGDVYAAARTLANGS
jgi:hypothetical protein